jgi:ElaB/YqjD/DUF883 family membrane-anchored ribosome-binding protein
MPNDVSTQLNNRLEVLETELQEMYKTLEAVVEETMVAYPNADAIQVLKQKFMQRVEPLLSRMSGQETNE